MHFSYPNRVYWCESCNIPLLSNSHCPVCGKKTIDAKLGKGEIKPIFDDEKKWYKELLTKEGHDPGILPDSMCFYYRGSIIVDGKKIFRSIYNEETGKWEVRFYKKYENFDGELVGTDMNLAVEANSLFLEQIEMDSLEQINKVYKEYKNLPHANSFSGGKDSAVTLNLVRYLDKDIPTIYMNTSIDFPETVEYIHNLTKMWGVNLIELHPSQDFFTLCDKLGPPSRFMRWCCKTSKFGPIGRYFNNNYTSDVLVASGIRANESSSRSEYEPVQRNSAIPNQILHFPILKWSSLMVWLYHYWRDIPINPAYYQGYSRIGCMICPEKTTRDLSRLKRTHKAIYSKYENKLIDYAKNNQISEIESWLNQYKWRFRAPKYSKQYVKIRKLCSYDDEVLYEIKTTSKMENIVDFFKIYGKIKVKNKLISINNHKLDLSIIKNSIRVKYYTNEPRIKKKFEKQLEKALNCVGCGSCISTCKNGAIFIKDGKRSIDTEKCTQCLQCLESNGLRKGCIALNYKREQIVIKKY